MLCAHTARRLKAGTYDEHQEVRSSIDPLVDAVIANGVYEIVASLTAEGANA